MAEKRREERNKAAQRSGTAAIQAHVSDFKNGLRIFSDIKAVRVKSRDYSLLVMEDYFPLMGAVNGEVEFLTPEDCISLGKLKGYYIHRNNEFSLIVEKYLEKGQEPETKVPVGENKE